MIEDVNNTYRRGRVWREKRNPSSMACFLIVHPTTNQGSFLRNENQGETGNVYRILKHFDFFHGHLGKLLVSVQVDTVANEASFSAFENAEVLSSIFANH